MALKLLDLEYLRAQNSSNGQVLVTSSTFGVEYTPVLVVKNGMVGIGTAPSKTLSVNGNISFHGVGSTISFPDGTTQSTAATTTPPGGSAGSVQYNTGLGTFGGGSDLFWNADEVRFGIGTNLPRSTLQIKDVGYESTNTQALDLDPVILDRFPVPDYRSCHYIVQVTDTNYSWFHTTQIMLIHDGIQAFKSEYNIVTTSEKLGEFDCQINGGNVELIFTAFYTSDKNIKVIRTSIEP